MKEVLIKIKKGNLKRDELKYFLEEALDILNLTDVELSVLITDDEDVRDLNRRFRNKDEPTDVLSFPMGDEVAGIRILGDIVVSVDTATRQAYELGVSLEERIKRLLIHGLLHLLGYDHEGGDKEAEEFFRLEEELFGKLNSGQNPDKAG